VDGLQGRRAVNRFMLMSGTVGVASAILLGLFFGRRLSRPLVAMSTALSRMARGDLDARIAVRSRDEIGRMGETVNQLASALQSVERTQKRATLESLALNERHARQRAALARLMRRAVELADDFVSALQEITEAVADALDSDRVGVWRYAEGGSIAVFDDLFERPTSSHSSGMVVSRAEWPEIFMDPPSATVIERTKRPREPDGAASYLTYLEQIGVTSHMRAQISRPSSVRHGRWSSSVSWLAVSRMTSTTS
jgi:HAMP domain-containing protein